MKPRVTLITLGVDDLERAVGFYRDGLGLKTEGIIGKEFEHGAVAFFELQAGLKLGIWLRKSLPHQTLNNPSGSLPDMNQGIGTPISDKIALMCLPD